MDPTLRKTIYQYLDHLRQAGLSDMLPPDPNWVPSVPSPTPAAPPPSASPTPAVPTPTVAATAAAPAPPPTPPAVAAPDAVAPTKTANVADPQQALQILAQEVTQCTACQELAPRRTQTVFGVGNPQPRLCFLGEGPGADEDRLGEPFVGKAGQLLDKIIAACQMKREDVYILNTVKCRPPGNRNPREDELQNCSHFLQRQLEILKPEFICCLGAVAAKSLLKTDQSIARMRQKFFSWGESQVVVTYHPAYLLRTPEAKAKTWADMKMLMEAMGVTL